MLLFVVYATFLQTSDVPLCNFFGLTRMKDHIYILCKKDSTSIQSIRVHTDTTPVDLLMLIHIEEILNAWELAHSVKSKCVYVSDLALRCLWKVSAYDHRVKKWLSNLPHYFVFTVDSEDQLVVLQYDALEIYGSDGILIQTIPLSSAISDPIRVLPKPNGQFIIVRERKVKNIPFLNIYLSLVNSVGHTIRQANFVNRSSFINSVDRCFATTDSNPHQEFDVCLTFLFQHVFLMADERFIWQANITGFSKTTIFSLLIDIKFIFDDSLENKYNVAMRQFPHKATKVSIACCELWIYSILSR